MITAILTRIAATRALALVRRHWRVLAVLALMLVVIVSVHAWMERECMRREVQLRQKYDRLLREAETKNREIETYWRNLVHEADLEHQKRLQAVETKYQGAVARIGVVRLCPRASDPATVSRDSPASGGDHAAAGDNGLPRRAGEAVDVGPGLVRLAHAAETQTARLVSCQQYIRVLESTR